MRLAAEGIINAVLIQDTRGDGVKLRGYKGSFSPSITRKKRNRIVVEAQVGVYLQDGGLDAAQIDTSEWCNENQEIVAVRTEIWTRRHFFISAYVRPEGTVKDGDNDFSWMEKFRRAYPNDEMVVGGDFNAENLDWGYARTSPRGRQLADAYEGANLLVVNDPTAKTRYGTNRRSGDTKPNLTLVTQRAKATKEASLLRIRRTKDPQQLAQVNNLTKEAKDHARNLSTMNWFALCESFNEHT
ncbi:hypothetical protein HPB47_023866 [Ixodes persulcatus]|uniref:Uncharacterized protein n=1 Tax=Ixodes persulcatus TaxID=34615 RepID=A0AC60Q5T5_IXOPE|nr:hypothetical protein HPB47_023866 [Ixodes persulcatus]